MKIVGALWVENKGMDMSDKTLLEKAETFARKMHAGQFRRDGVTPYIEHPKRVSELVVGGEIEQSVAWLHDVIEDCGATLRDFIDAGVGCLYVEVVGLTHINGEDYFDYIRKVKWSSVTRSVKIADIVANLTDKPTEKQIRKYIKAITILSERD